MADVNDIIKKYGLKTYGGKDDFLPTEIEPGKVRFGFGKDSKWSAPCISEPDALREYIDAIGIVGATINEIAIVSDYILDFSGHRLCPPHPKNVFEEKRLFQFIDEFVHNWFIGYCDNPVIIVTNKGNFEINYCESGIMQMSKDKLPEFLYIPVSYKGWDIRKIFASLKGRKITGYIVDECDYDTFDFTYTGTHKGMFSKEEQETYIQHLKFVLDDGQMLEFTNNFDDGKLSVLDANGKTAIVPARGSYFVKDCYRVFT